MDSAHPPQPISIDVRLCLVCGCCVGACPANAMFLAADRLTIDFQNCTLCGRCVDVCPAAALKFNPSDPAGKNAR